MQPPPHPPKAVEPTTALLSSEFNQYTLLTWLSDVEAQAKPLDNAMVIDEPAKPVAGSSKHPDDMDIVDSELDINSLTHCQSWQRGPPLSGGGCKISYIFTLDIIYIYIIYLIKWMSLSMYN